MKKGRKKSGKATRATKSQRTSMLTEDPKSRPEEESNPFDFGGIPSRDLKKNLGCG